MLELISGDYMIVLPDGLKTIEERVFAGIAAETVIVSDGCVSIAGGAFANWPNLTEIIVPAGCAVVDGACDASAVITRI